MKDPLWLSVLVRLVIAFSIIWIFFMLVEACSTPKASKRVTLGSVVELGDSYFAGNAE